MLVCSVGMITRKTLGLVFLGSINYNISNIMTYLSNQHKDESLKLKHSEDLTTNTSDLRNSNHGGKVSVQSSTKSSVILDKCSTLLYKCFCTLNIDTKQAENMYLNELPKYLVDHSHVLKGRFNDVTFFR